MEESLFAKGGAGRVIANSEMVKNEIVALHNYPADKIDIVRNGVPLDRFRFDTALREKSRNDLKLKPDDIALLFTGAGKKQRDVVRLQFQIISRFFTQRGIKTKSIERNAIANDVDLVRRIIVKRDDLVFHHFRIGDHATRAAFGKQRFLHL